MSKIINLNRVRKQTARDVKRRTSDANAAKHGQTKTQTALEKARSEKARRGLDGHELE